jgi:hypothetical protein
MAKHHRVFIAFAMEDIWARDYLVGQMRNGKTPFQWTDMSVKQPWANDWRNQCTQRIRGCDGMIALVSRNTAQAVGQLFEIRTAVEVGMPVIGIYTTTDSRPAGLPIELRGIPVRDWTWDNIVAFLNRL